MIDEQPLIGPVTATKRAQRTESGDTPSERQSRIARRLLRLIARRAQTQTTRVIDEFGQFEFGTGSDVVEVRVHDTRTYWKSLTHGSIGLAESYIDGWWDTDDLTEFLRRQIHNLATPLSRLDDAVTLIDRPWSALQHLRRPSKASDRHNVRAHYDLPGELFDIMLDETMMYSCAYFDSPETSLHEAQLSKLEMICRKLDLGPDDHLLEIGSGWGGLAIYAARTRGCRVTTTTLSLEQRKVALARIEAAGLADRIDVLDRDYRDLTGTYDKLVSVEMIEAVDWRLHETFFTTCEHLLKPSGLMLIQAITIADRSYARARFHHDFIKEFIFPGGCLPSITSMTDTLTRTTELRVISLDDIGSHYVTTLQRWRENFSARWDDVAPPGFGSEFRRLWELYLAYCEAGFLERHVSDVQLVIAGPQWRAR